MLGVERERDPEGAGAGHFSTPVMTMPFTKTRWNTRNRMIGMIIVIRVPAWMKAWFR